MEPLNAAPPPIFLPPGFQPPPPLPFPNLPIDENGIVKEEVLCRKCAYNLRGLHQNGKCPECGTPVGLSIRGNLLCYSDPEWVDKLARGVDLILWGLLAMVVATAAAMVLGIAMGPRAQILGQIIGVAASVGAAQLIRSMLYGISPLDPSVFVSVIVMLILVAAAACLVPAWRASRLDPTAALRAE